MSKNQIIDMIGEKYGRLTVIKFVESKKEPSGGYVRYYQCLCDCGNKTIVRGRALRNGNTKSCGCLRKERTTKYNLTHGKTKTRIYRIYRSMIDRCYNEHNKSYNDYGKRGIKICNEWLGENGFDNFYKWSVENNYKSNLSIDRIDNDKGYSPDNCRWATNQEQANNKRNNRLYTWNGETHTLKEWGEIKPNELKYTTLAGRIYSGWNIEDVFGLTIDEVQKRKSEKMRNNQYVKGKTWKRK